MNYKVNNLPLGTSGKYTIIRKSEDEYYYYGDFEDLARASEIASEIDNGIVVESKDVKRADKKSEAYLFVNLGGKCYSRYGFAFKGAGRRAMTKEEALVKLSKSGWSFGKGYYELRWETDTEGEVLVFNEYSESDMW